MRKLILLGLVFAAQALAAFSSSYTHCKSDVLTTNACSIDTTGKDLVVVVAYENIPSPGSPVETGFGGANTWVQVQTSTSYLVWYTHPAHTGAGSISLNSGPSSGEFQVLAFSGSLTSAGPDAITTIKTSNDTLTQFITPNQSNELVLSLMGVYDSGATPTLSAGSFTQIDAFSNAGGDTLGGGSAFLIQTTVGPTSATWNAAGFTLYHSLIAFPSTVSTMTGTAISTLVVAGGGSAGTGNGGTNYPGGGAGGGLLTGTLSRTVGSYQVIVGTGASGVTGSAYGANGQDSSFEDLIAKGGGGGALYGHAGVAGGSGGGAGSSYLNGGLPTQTNRAPLTGYGNQPQSAGSNNCSGGGGAGAHNFAATTYGDYGLSSSITGSAVLYAAGGNCFGATGAAASDTGNGGVGTDVIQTSAAGGSGVVIVSYPTSAFCARGGTKSVSGANTIHTFTSVGGTTCTPSTPCTFQITATGTCAPTSGIRHSVSGGE
jgi:hypothetical protein